MEELFVYNAATGFLDGVILKDRSFIREAFAPGVEGLTRYYCMYDQDAKQLYLGPTPAAIYTFELYYTYDPPSLADAGSSGETWLSLHAEEVLTFGTLIEAGIFQRAEDAQMKEYRTTYGERMVMFKKYADGVSAKDAYGGGV